MDRKTFSDSQLRNRQRLGAALGYGSAALGLSALGVRGGAGAIRLANKTGKLRPLQRSEATAMKLERASNTIGTAAAGAGGAAGLNGAALSLDASRRHRVKKDLGMMQFGTYGEVGKRLTDVEKKASTDLAVGTGASVLGTGIAGGLTEAYRKEKRKRERMAKAYDPERNRGRRMDAYSIGAAGAGGALATGSVMQGRKAYRAARDSSSYMKQGKAGQARVNSYLANQGGKGARASTFATAARHNAGVADAYRKSADATRSAVGHSGKAAALAAGSAGAFYGAEKIRQHKRGRGRPYPARTW